MTPPYNLGVIGGWRTFLDETAAPEERAGAWHHLGQIMRQPVLLQMRRCMEGRRRTEQLAEEFCDQVRIDYEGRGLALPRFRLLVIEELDRYLVEQGIEDAEFGEEFDRDWTSGLLQAALHGLKRIDATAHTLLLRAYNRPDDRPPFTARELAAKLEVDPDEVEQAITEGTQELRELFGEEIARTVSDPDVVPAEVNHLTPFVGAIFPDSVAT
jgi:hypothetical protein